ncbi:hypothetical protein ACFXDE_17520 [Kitasatospora sp. NPDC059408]
MPTQPAVLYELATTHPAGMGDIEHAVTLVRFAVFAMEYATPVPAQPALL